MTSKEKQREASRRWREANPERLREIQREYNARHPGRRREQDRRRREANPEAFKERYRWAHVRKTYGLTRLQWEALFDEQGRRCGCCGTDKPTKQGWVVDHDHDTGTVRGILCQYCNVMLGNAMDDPTRLESGIRYLSRMLLSR